MTNEQDKPDRDAGVSRTYRLLANETAPERLNRQVLSMAVEGARPKARGGFASISWMRPVAWAATVGLCLAIVLEVTENPVPNVENEPAAAVESLKEEFAPKDNDTLEAARERARLQAGSKLQVIAEPAPEPSRNDAPAEESRKGAKRLPAAAAVMLDSAELDSASGCDATERRSPEEWLLCIKNLRDMGYDDEADQEYAAYALKYPAESAPVEPNK